MKVAIYTLGCKVNQYETQAMEQELLARGHTLTEFSDEDIRWWNFPTRPTPMW